jgi:ABC-type multidrug transport system fused ATPase/permease subunit
MVNYLKSLINRLEEREKKLQSLSDKISRYRLFIFIIGLILFFILFFSASNITALIEAVISSIFFGIAANKQSKVDNGIKRLKLWKKIKETHIARINLDWDNIPRIEYSSDNQFTPAEIDLNIAGEQSLHQLINTGTTRRSKTLLRKWLNNINPSTGEIFERQKFVKELIPLKRFRDKLILNSVYSIKNEFDGEFVEKLLSKTKINNRYFRLIYITLTILAPVNIILLVLNTKGLMSPFWPITTFIYISLYTYGNKTKKGLMDESEYMMDESEYLSGELEKMRSVFEFLENSRFNEKSKLYKLCIPFHIYDERPSYLIKKLKSTSGLLRIKKGNWFVWLVIAAVFPLDFYFHIKYTKQKKIISKHIHEWVGAWNYLEALCSLANFGFLNPDYNFPEIKESNDQNEILFTGKNLGHPLLTHEQKICNDFSFSHENKIAIITGSNMSGKSTFLRTLGINLSLAYAGCVVNADVFNVSLLRLFTCIKVSDSVVDGISYFYAEVKRLKSLLNEIERADSMPVFFLIDEIFRGTNNIERLKGSSAFIKKIADKNVIGAVATHDLELINLSEKILQVHNYHFKEEIKDGKMLFDYKIHEGPCPTTNALKIMQIEGLPVE